MKKLLFLVGFTGSVFLALSATSRGAPPDGFHGRFVAHNGGRPAFRIGRGVQRDFSFHQNRHFPVRDHRFLFTRFAWPVYWYPYYCPDYYYPVDRSYLDDGQDSTRGEATAPGQSEYIGRAAAPGPTVIVLNQGGSRSNDSSNSEYAAEGQQRIAAQKSNEQSGLRVEPSTIVNPAAAKDAPAAVQATPVASQAPAGNVDKMVLVSWLEDGGKDVIYVQNTQTNEVQKITSEPNIDNFRIVEVHRNSDPRQVEAVISNGSEQVPVRFRF